MPTSTNSIEALIASHRAAAAAVDRLGDDVTDGELTIAVGAETSALRAIVDARCDDEAYFTKLEHFPVGLNRLGIPESAWF